MGGDVEADRNRMTGAGDNPFDAELVAQADIQSVGEHDETRRDFLAVGQHDRLALRAGRDRGGLGRDGRDPMRDCGTHGVDQGVVPDAVLPARALVDENAETGDPVGSVEGAGGQHGVRKPGLAQTGVLLVAADFFATQFWWMHSVRIDQNGGDAGSAKHNRGGRSGEAPSNDGDIRMAHDPFPEKTVS